MKAGYIALLGLPNAGKSTLTNALVGEKVSIVTAKPQTTRGRVLGLRTEDDVQMIFMDAPGFIESESGLNTFLKAELQDVVQDADLLLVTLNLDVPEPAGVDHVIEIARASRKPFMVVITKADLRLDHRVLVLKDKVKDHPVVVGSALKKPAEMSEEILGWIRGNLPPAERFFYPDDEYTGQNLRQISAEIVREKCFEFLHQEIPYSLAVRIEKFVEEEIIKIFAEILIEKESHKPIVIGGGGTMLKKIGTAARQELEKLLGSQVYLQLHVSVQKSWQKDPRILKELGYVIPE